MFLITYIFYVMNCSAIHFDTLNIYRYIQYDIFHDCFNFTLKHSRTQTLEDTTKRMTYREMNMILRHEGGEDGLPVDCCPTVEEMVEPVGGRNRENMYVQLYRDGQNAQRFFEYSCRPDVLDKPCRFIDRKFTNQSRCVQKFSYTYAIIENSGSTVRGAMWIIFSFHSPLMITSL